jgi:hypothetical protein
LELGSGRGGISKNIFSKARIGELFKYEVENESVSLMDRGAEKSGQ